MEPADHFEPFMTRHASGPVTVYADADLVPSEGIRDLLRLPETLVHLPGTASRQAGRRTVWRWRPPWFADRRLVVRQFAHGGLLGRLWGTLFVSRQPMLRDLQIALHARSRGVPTCRPVALRLERVRGLLWRAHYVSEEIPGAQNLLELCRREARAPHSPRDRQELARAVAGAVAAMHDAGIWHGDLNLKNLLVAGRGSGREVYAIDFKKARLQNHVALDAGLRNVLRLDRSVTKRPVSRQVISGSDRLRTLRAYLTLHRAAEQDWKNIARTICTRRSGH